jgi:ribonuclease P protein subunit RPR2
MKKKYQKKSSKQKEIARERIKVLFKQAKEVFNKNKSLANRYIKLARELAMKYKIRIPPELKRRFCKHCYKYLMPGKNVRVRTREGKVVYYCLECKKYMRFPYLKERKAKRIKK